MNYSIWVIPPEPLYSQLKAKIQYLAVAYDAPTFEPHMTVLGDISANLAEIEANVKKVARKLDELNLSLGPVSFSNTYFQSVFIRVTSTANLMQINLELKSMFGMENNVFMPHISLIYGNHSMTVRETITQNLKPIQASFLVNKFVITPSTANTKEWEHVSTIPFG